MQTEGDGARALPTEGSVGVTISQRLVAINAASSVIARLLNISVLLWMYQYLLTRISPEEFAVYAVLMALMVFAPLFFSVFTGGVSRHVVEAYARGDTRRVTEVTSSILPLLAAAALVFLATGLTLAFTVEHVLTIAPEMVETARLMLALLVANYAMQMAMLPLTTGFHVRQRFVELNLLGIARDLLRMVLLLALLLGVGASVLWVVVAAVIAEQAHLAAVVLRSRRMVPEIRFSPGLVRRGTAFGLISFGLWTTLGQLANVMYVNAATLVLNAHGTALDVTNYHLGATFFRQIQSMIGLASQPLQPALTAMHAVEDKARLARTALRGGRYGLWVSLILACPLAIYAEPFVRLYLGPEFADAGRVLALMMAIFPVVQAVSLLPMLAMATGQVRTYNLAALGFSLVSLLLMIGLTVYGGLGALGVALPLVGVTVVAQITYFWPLQARLVGLGARDFLQGTLVPGLLPGTAGSLAWLGLSIAVPPESWLVLATEAAAGAVVYLVVLTRFCLAPDERGNLLPVLARFVPGLRSRKAKRDMCA